MKLMSIHRSHGIHIPARRRNAARFRGVARPRRMIVTAQPEASSTPVSSTVAGADGASLWKNLSGPWLHLTHERADPDEVIRLAIGVHVLAPVSTVYELWRNFDALPYFMRGDGANANLDGSRCVWLISAAGREMLWEANAGEQVPCQRITWKDNGRQICPNEGAVEFRAVRPHISYVAITIEFNILPDHAGDAIQTGLAARLKRTLDGFHTLAATHAMQSSSSEVICLTTQSLP